MSDETRVSAHYTHGGLREAIRSALVTGGRSLDALSIDDLAPVDEFHIGGRQASQAFLEQLAPGAGEHVLDVGCGLGGTARFVAQRFGSRVSGIDLTPEYVTTGNEMCAWVGLADRVELREGSALNLPFADRTFEKAYMLHVGMNIEDKAGLCREVFRVLREGGAFGVYDVMRVGEGELVYPVPWAASASTSAVAPPDDYRSALQAAGFSIVAERNRRDFALQFFQQLRERHRAAGGPPPLGIHILMGTDVARKVENMLNNIEAGVIAPVEMLAHRT